MQIWHIYIMYKKQKIFSKNKKDSVMACRIPPLKKAKKQGEMPLPSLGPSPSLNPFCFSEKFFCFLFSNESTLKLMLYFNPF